MAQSHEEESSIPTLKEFIAEQNISNDIDIYAKLVEIGFDWNTLLHIESGDLELLAKEEMNLPFKAKVKFKSAVKLMQSTYKAMTESIIDRKYHVSNEAVPTAQCNPPSRRPRSEVAESKSQSQSLDICIDTQPAESYTRPSESNPFKAISKADGYMKNKVNKPFKQHSVLKSIFEIPSSLENAHQQTCDKAAAIKEMQIQYTSSRLSTISKLDLNAEFEIRQRLIECNRKIKEELNILTASFVSEIQSDRLLLEMKTKNKTNRQTSRNMEQCQYVIQTRLNEAARLIDKMITTSKAVEEYVVFDRQLLMKTENGQYFGTVDARMNQIIDTDVINFFVANLNTLNKCKSELDEKQIKFELHVQSDKYRDAVGTLKEIKTGYECHVRNAKQRKNEYKEVTAILTYYKDINLNRKDVQKLLKNNDLKGTITQINTKYSIDDGKTEMETMQSITEIADDTVKSKQSTHVTRKKKKSKKAEIDPKQRSLNSFFQPLNKKRSFNQMNNHNNRSLNPIRPPLRKKQRLSMCSGLRAINLDLTDQ